MRNLLICVKGMIELLATNVGNSSQHGLLLCYLVIIIIMSVLVTKISCIKNPIDN